MLLLLPEPLLRDVLGQLSAPELMVAARACRAADAAARALLAAVAANAEANRLPLAAALGKCAQVGAIGDGHAPGRSESGFIETAYNQRVVLRSIPALLVLRT